VKISSRIFVFLAIIALLALVACGGSDDASSETEAPAPTEAPVESPKATDMPKATEPAAEATAKPTATEEEQPKATEPAAEPTAEPESGIPYDIPVMDGAQDLLVLTETGSVTYMLEEMDIEQVYDFYDNQLTEMGWEPQTSSAIGMMATLVFETEQARVSVSLQANTIAKTVNVRLFILDK
jgi:hypothetical protein